jgi:zinc transporter, ZIP family
MGNNLETLTLITIAAVTVSLLGTMAGAAIGIIVKNPSNKLLGIILGFAGGLMLSVVVFELIPEAIEKWSLVKTVILCIVGSLVMLLIDISFSSKTIDSHKKTALMTAIALMIHNFPEGIIMGCGFAAGGSFGIQMSAIIAIHDIPEGIAVAAPLMASKTGKSKILLYAFITAFPTVIGALIGMSIAKISSEVLGICMSLASGIMLYVVCGEMVPESIKIWQGISGSIGILSGILLGLVITNII